MKDMYTRFFSGSLLILMLGLTACGTFVAAREMDNRLEKAVTPATPEALPQFPPDTCPITRPPDLVFVPPKPYHEIAHYGQFWYGHEDLWTALHPDGRWYALPHDEQGYTQKVFWWRQGYDPATEPQPRIAMSGRRIDGEAPDIETSGGTNGYHPELGYFMLTGVKIPTAGCWEFTGSYGKAEITFTVWVAP
jgi:hypothetical protein